MAQLGRRATVPGRTERANLVSLQRSCKCEAIGLSTNTCSPSKVGLGSPYAGGARPTNPPSPTGISPCPRLGGHPGRTLPASWPGKGLQE
eukprot:2789368-Lingulodinium_polyedra.AAC.1